MPLLRRQPFQKQKPPPDLDPDEEVFHCKLTNEIFRDYEEFFERIILCNSLLWSCEITGKWGLTYQEAVETEERARRHLATFPDYLQRPILYLANLTHRSRLAGMNDDVFVFAKDRYFIGEIVDVVHEGIRKPYKIVCIIPPTEEQIQKHAINGDVEDGTEDGIGNEKSQNQGLDPTLYTYVVKDTMSDETLTVKTVQISRKKGLYTRDKSKLFLKQNCYVVDGVWTVKDSIIKSLKLMELRFESFFAGPKPLFAVSQAKRKKNSYLNPNINVMSQSPSDNSMNDYTMRGNDAKKNNNLSDKNKQLKAIEDEKMAFMRMSPEEREAFKERVKQEKIAERNARREEIKRRLDEEKEKRRLERERERDKKREEKRIQAEYLKEWSRPRDDLECEDLKSLPDLLPVQTRLPQELFGDALMVLEFIHTFQSLFDLNEYFPSGMTLEVLEEALLDNDVNGPLTDLLLMLLVAIFYLQESEEEEEDPDLSKGKTNIPDFSEEMCYSDRSTMANLLKNSAIMAQYPMLTHGTPLRNLQLDSFTLTEILRLHLISSAAKANANNVKFRYQQRGGYTAMDDAGIHLCKELPELMKSLSEDNIFDMPPESKLKTLSTLVHQFLTYAASRDLVEDNFERLRQLKMDLKQLQWSELRREREEATARYKRSVEERLRERKQLEMKIANEALRQAGVEVNNGITEEKEKPDKKTSRSRLVQIDKFNKLEDLEKINEQELTPEEKDAYWQKREQLDAKKKSENLEKEKEFLNSIAKLQQGNAVYPLGRDRMYRRYWTFSSLPGLFVEDNDDTVPSELLPNSKKDGEDDDDDDEEEEEDVDDEKDKEDGDGEKEAVKKEKDDEKEGNDENEGDGQKAVDGKEEDGEEKSKKEKEEDSKEGGDKTVEDGLIKQESEAPSLETKTEPMETDKQEATSEKKGSNGVIDLTDMTDDSMDKSEEDDDEEYDDDDDDEDEDERPAYLDSEFVQNIINRVRVHWTYIKSPEQFNQLMDSLNSRGFREGLLKQILLENSDRIQESIGNCPFEDPEDVEQRMKKEKNKNGSKDSEEASSAKEILELNLRDLLLDLEERIYVGGLGSVKVKDRLQWRAKVEGNLKSEKPASDQESGGESGDGNIDNVVKCLAKALLQIAHGVESRYMREPFGDSEELRKSKLKLESSKDQKNKKKDEKADKSEDSDENEEKVEVTPKSKSKKSVFERWEESLSNCTSFPQIFLHLSSLEKSIIWSKSALHARCRICRRKGDGEHMLLCDGCDRGHHMYCLKPPVKTVPDGDWFCPNCKPKEARPSPRKGQRHMYVVDSEESEEDDEEEANSNEEEEEEEENEDSENQDSSSDSAEQYQARKKESRTDNACVVCGRRGALVICDKCPNVYHLSCANPPLKKVPRTKWLCGSCSGLDKKSKRNSSGRGSSHSVSKKDSPRNSPLNARSRKRARSESDEDVAPKRSRHAAKGKTSSLAETEESDIKHYVSSYRGNSKEYQLKACEDLINDLMKHEDSWPFLRPVSKKMVPDYYDIIKHPMDFSTIRNRIHKYQYTEPIALLKDTRLIFSNCKEYNKKSAPEFKAGASLSTYFEKQVKDLQLEDGEHASPSSSLQTDSGKSNTKKKSRN